MRQDLDPRLWARGHVWIVGLGAGTVVPVRLGRDVDRWRWWRVSVVGGRGIPPRTRPEWGANHDEPVSLEGAVESGVPVKSGMAVESVTAMETLAPVPASMAPVAPCVGGRCRNENECNH